MPGVQPSASRERLAIQPSQGCRGVLAGSARHQAPARQVPQCGCGEALSAEVQHRLSSAALCTFAGATLGASTRKFAFPVHGGELPFQPEGAGRASARNGSAPARTREVDRSSGGHRDILAVRSVTHWRAARSVRRQPGRLPGEVPPWPRPRGRATLEAPAPGRRRQRRPGGQLLQRVGPTDRATVLSAIGVVPLPAPAQRASGPRLTTVSLVIRCRRAHPGDSCTGIREYEDRGSPVRPARCDEP
jgi:hypothetical protein